MLEYHPPSRLTLVSHVHGPLPDFRTEARVSRRNAASLFPWIFFLSLALLIVSTGALKAQPAAHQAPPCASQEARQFDFWIGEWNIINKTLQEDGSWARSGEATVRVYPVAQGCAIVEHWEGTNRATALKGFSLRVYNPATRKWNLVLNWPQKDRPFFFSLEGAFQHGRGEFFFESERDGKAVLTRYSFSDIQEQSLRWDLAYSLDQGKTWRTDWIMEMSRRNPATDAPLFNGPSPGIGETPLCSAGSSRGYDFLTGHWSTDPAALRNNVQLDSYKILGGCAVMFFLKQLGTDPLEIFGVLAFEPSLGKWVQYLVDTRNPIIQRFETVPGQEVTEFISSGTGDPARLRIRWSEVAAASLHFEMARSSDGGRKWQKMNDLKLVRR